MSGYKQENNKNKTPYNRNTEILIKHINIFAFFSFLAYTLYNNYKCFFQILSNNLCVLMVQCTALNNMREIQRKT